MHRAFREASGEIEVLWRTASPVEQRILAAIGTDVPLNSRRAAEQFRLAKSGSTRLAAEALEAEGHIIPAVRASGFAIVDPFLHVWLANGRRWPLEDEVPPM